MKSEENLSLEKQNSEENISIESSTPLEFQTKAPPKKQSEEPSINIQENNEKISSSQIQPLINLALKDLQLSREKLEKEWDLDLANLTAGAPAAAAPVDAGKTEFNVVLTGFDSSKKINVLKAIKTIKGIGLMEAKQFVEGDMPATVDTDVAKDQAEKFKKEIEDAGGQVELK